MKQSTRRAFRIGVGEMKNDSKRTDEEAQARDFFNSIAAESSSELNSIEFEVIKANNEN